MCDENSHDFEVASTQQYQPELSRKTLPNAVHKWPYFRNYLFDLGGPNLWLSEQQLEFRVFITYANDLTAGLSLTKHLS